MKLRDRDDLRDWAEVTLQPEHDDYRTIAHWLDDTSTVYLSRWQRIRLALSLLNPFRLWRFR